MKTVKEKAGCDSGIARNDIRHLVRFTSSLEEPRCLLAGESSYGTNICDGVFKGHACGETVELARMSLRPWTPRRAFSENGKLFHKSRPGFARAYRTIESFCLSAYARISLLYSRAWPHLRRIQRGYVAPPSQSDLLANFFEGSYSKLSSNKETITIRLAEPAPSILCAGCARTWFSERTPKEYILDVFDAKMNMINGLTDIFIRSSSNGRVVVISSIISLFCVMINESK